LRTLEGIGAAITRTIKILDARLVLAQLEGDEERCAQINLELKDPTEQLKQHEQNVKLIKQWIGDTKHTIERKTLLDKTFLDAIEQGNP